MLEKNIIQRVFSSPSYKFTIMVIRKTKKQTAPILTTNDIIEDSMGVVQERKEEEETQEITIDLPQKTLKEALRKSKDSAKKTLEEFLPPLPGFETPLETPPPYCGVEQQPPNKPSSKPTTPKSARKNSIPVPPQPSPSPSPQSKEDYKKTRLIDACKGLLVVIEKSGKTPPPHPHKGIWDRCTHRELLDYRTDLFKCISSGTDSRLVKSGYYLGLGVIETGANILSSCVAPDNQMLQALGSLPPGTIAKSVKKHDDVTGGNIDTDLDVLTIFLQDYIPSHPAFSLLVDTFYAISAVVANPMVYASFGGGGGGPAQYSNSQEEDERYSRREEILKNQRRARGNGGAER